MPSIDKFEFPSLESMNIQIPAMNKMELPSFEHIQLPTIDKLNLASITKMMSVTPSAEPVQEPVITARKTFTLKEVLPWIA